GRAEAQRHPVLAQRIDFGQPQLHCVISEKIDDSRVDLGLLPVEEVASRRRAQELGKLHNRTDVSHPPSAMNRPVEVSISPLPAFSDNYLWLLDRGGHAAVVDPGDAEPVLKALAGRRLQLDAILVTHH